MHEGGGLRRGTELKGRCWILKRELDGGCARATLTKNGCTEESGVLC